MRSIMAGSKGMALVIIPILLLGAVGGFVYWGSISGGNGSVLTDNLAEPLDGVTAARFDINAGDGNLTIDGLTGGEQLLAGGTMQYLENQGLPTRTLVMLGDQATLTLVGGTGSQPGFRLPWAACNGATEWHIHLNPTASSDITAHSNGGNVKLDLAGMTLTHLLADTGGGNMDVVLPNGADSLDITAKTGAGNVTIDIGRGTIGSGRIIAGSGAGNVVVRIPSGIAARIHVTAGLGKVTVDPQFSKVRDNTYQSPDYDKATDRIEITLSSGAGDVIIETK